MHRSPRVIACAVLVALVTACSSGDDDGQAVAPGGSTGPTGAITLTGPATTSPTDNPATEIPGNGVTGSPTDQPAEFATGDRVIRPPDHQVKLERIRTERSGSVERVVIDITGSVPPGVQTRYVDMVTIEGDPVPTDGSAALELVLEAADPTGEQGLSQDVISELYPRYPIVRDVLYARYLAGTVVFAIGVSDRVPYRVLTDKSKVVIEFQH
jgi:hypothetical protein